MPLSPTALKAETIELIRRGGGSRPDVARVRYNGGEAILKDQNGCDAAFARLLGPLLAGREARALQRLCGVRGVPAMLARPDRRSILIEYVPSTPLTRARHDDWPAFFEALEALLDEMHARGVAHCDLRSPNNTLVDTDGRPVLVDFVANFQRGASWNFVSAWIFGLFCGVDRRAVLKLKSIVAPELVAPAERHLLEHRPGLQRGVRRLGMIIRDIARRLFTRSGST